jgi:hypothetical protein
MVDGAANVLARLNVEDVKERASGALQHPSLTSYRTFEGLQLDFDGYREGTNAWVRVHASVDPETAKRLAASRAPDQSKAADQGKGGDQGKKAPEVKPLDPEAEAALINARTQAFDFQIPVYQYDQIYRPLQDLLAPAAKPPTAGPKESK